LVAKTQSERAIRESPDSARTHVAGGSGFGLGVAPERFNAPQKTRGIFNKKGGFHLENRAKWRKIGPQSQPIAKTN
jgi:hypothetical protein